MYKLLIIEDEKLLREGLIEMIDFNRFQCVLSGEAYNGTEGIRLIQQLQPDIVLLDLYMPLVNGIDVLKATKNRFDYQAIIITGHAEFEYAQKAVSLGVSDYLLKPIEQEELNQALEKVIKKLEPLKKKQVNAQYSNYTNQALEFIEQNLAKDLSLGEISKHLQISADYLNRVFKQDTGMTIHTAVQKQRIEQACLLLEDSNSRVYEVAHQVGYKDYKYFHQVFKQMMKVSPKKYQQSIQKNVSEES